MEIEPLPHEQNLRLNVIGEFVINNLKSFGLGPGESLGTIITVILNIIHSTEPLPGQPPIDRDQMLANFIVSLESTHRINTR